jgi:hypothetical protein
MPEIQHRQAEIEALHAEIFGQKAESAPKPAPRLGNIDLDDADLLAKAGRATNGDKFTRLWAGDMTGYSSHSEADLALCSHLAFYCGGDPGRIDRLFRRSGLYRPKWDEKHGAVSYGQMTIRKALEGTTEFYQPGKAGSNGHHANGHQQIPEALIAKGAGADTAEAIPVLPDDVWTGWLAGYRDWILPTTDGSIEGIFGTGSVKLGLSLGRNIGIHYGVPTFGNLFIALCGPTGVPRKTTFISRSQSVQARAFTEDYVRVARSIGSAKGLLERFCKEVEEGEGKSKRTILAYPRAARPIGRT